MNGEGQIVGNRQPGSDDGELAVRSTEGDNGAAGPRWSYDRLRAAGDEPADLGAGLISLSFIRAAIRRSRWFWCLTAVTGLLAGLGLYRLIPASYEASTTLYMTYGPYENALSVARDEAALAQSRAVAGLAAHKLGLRQSPGDFAATYTVTPVSGRVLTITVRGPSGSAALRRANALAAAFLQFRAGQLNSELRLMVRSLGQEASAAPAHANQLTGQIQQQRAATTAAVRGSTVIDAAAVIPQSKAVRLLIYAGLGLVAGFMLGMGIAVVRAVTSDRLCQREEIARALGAPVRLSVGRVRVRRWWPGRIGLRTARRADIQRIVAHLESAVPPGSAGAPALAVIPADDPRVGALALLALAVSAARQGRKVVVADLWDTAPAARILRARKPGVREVRAHGAQLIVAVPGRRDLPCAGPRAHREERVSPLAATVHPGRCAFTAAVTAACASADLVLTLAALDPSLGSEHLATWATDAVVTVTAGRCSWMRVHAVGGMVRAAGMRLESAVLIGADKADESLGTGHAPADGHPLIRSGNRAGRQ